MKVVLFWIKQDGVQLYGLRGILFPVLTGGHRNCKKKKCEVGYFISF